MPRIEEADGHGNITATFALPDDPRDVAAATIQDRARAALAANDAFLTASAGIVAPLTNAQTNALVAHVRTVTKECSGLIRLALLAFDSTAGT
jgi:hypothetical protein